MKILFYSEIHPIRESHLNHTWILKELLSMLGSENPSKFRILANPNLCEDLQSGSRFFFDFTKKEKESISSFESCWDSSSIESWQKLMLGENEVLSKFYCDILDRIRKEYPFSILVYWGTNKTIKDYCDRLNIPSVSMELGCTRDPYFKKTVYMDLAGVNGENSMLKISEDTILKTKTNIRKNLALTEDNTKETCLNSPVQDALFYKNWGKNVLIPLQLDDDANIVLYTKYGSVLDFVKDNVEAFTSRGYSCFVKPHPGAVLRKFNSDEHTKIREYVNKTQGAYWIECPSLQAIEKSNYVVAVNSSFAFEATLLGKVAVNNGGSCWNLPGFFPTRDMIFSENFDREDYLKKTNKLAEFLLEYYLIPYDKAFNLNFFKKHLTKLFCFYREGGSNSVRTNYRVNSASDYISSYANKQEEKNNSTNVRQMERSEELVISQTESNSVVGKIYGDRVVHQEFTCTKKNLWRVDLKLATHKRENAGDLNLNIYDPELNVVVRSVTIPCKDIADNLWRKITFDPIPESCGKNYTLVLKGIGCDPGNSITAYYNKTDTQKMYLGKLSFGEKTSTILGQITCEFFCKDVNI